MSGSSPRGGSPSSVVFGSCWADVAPTSSVVKIKPSRAPELSARPSDEDYGMPPGQIAIRPSGAPPGAWNSSRPGEVQPRRAQPHMQPHGHPAWAWPHGFGLPAGFAFPPQTASGHPYGFPPGWFPPGQQPQDSDVEDQSSKKRKETRRGGSRERRRRRHRGESRDEHRPAQSRDEHRSQKDHSRSSRSRSRSRRRHHRKKISKDDEIGEDERKRKEERKIKRMERELEKEYDRLTSSLKRAVRDGVLEKAFITAAKIIDMGRQPSPDLLRSILSAVVAKRGATKLLFAAMEVCAAGKVTIEPKEYARLLGKLLSRGACAAACRGLLNMALPKNAPPIPCVPEGLTKEEAVKVWDDNTVLGGVIASEMKADEGKPPQKDNADDFPQEDNEDLEDVPQEDNEDLENVPFDGETENSAQGIPDNGLEILVLAECVGQPELNGEYVLSEAMPDVLGHDRPVYVKTDGLLAQADTEEEPSTNVDIFVYFWQEEDAPWRMGWYIAAEVGSDEYIGYNPHDALKPPENGWLVVVDGVRRADPASFRPRPAEEAEGLTKEEEKALQVFEERAGTLDENAVRGCISSSKPGVAPYFGHFIVLLHLERMAELETYRRRFSRFPASKMKRIGWALIDLVMADSFGKREKKKNSLPGWPDGSSEYVAFWMPKNVDLDRLRFKKGESVVISRTEPLTDAIGEGVVESIDWRKLVINVHAKLPPDAKSVTWRVDSYANQVVYERQVKALLQLVDAVKSDPICEILVSADVGKLDSWAEQFTHESAPPWRQICDEKSGVSAETAGMEIKENAAAEEKQTTPNRCAVLSREDPQSGGNPAKAADRREKIHDFAHETTLNDSQRSAIMQAAINRCSIVQGPPGTGKTHVSVHILQAWVGIFGLKPVLATSDSNIAVDNIAEGLGRAGVKVVRLGRPDKFREHLEDIALDNLLAKKKKAKAAAAAIEKARKEEENVAKEGVFAKVEEETTAVSSATEKPKKAKSEWIEEHDQKKKQRQEDFKLRKEILQDADVICVTTTSSGGEILRGFKFQGILIDEVAQATELSAIVPIVLRGTRQLVLVGDHCQLPPSVVSREAELRGLSLSLYQRLANSGLKPGFLDIQYRSHPQIVEFSAKVFYQDALKSGIDASSRPLPAGVPWPNPEVPIAFFESSAAEVVDGESKSNPQEVNHVLALVQQALASGELGPEDVGIVTPYMAQVRALRKTLREWLPPDQRRLLEIASVDNFQGREKELIIFSAVRSNHRGNVGFLADWRRLNVMLTRARRGLVVIGNAKTLRYDSHWQQWLEWCHHLGVACKAPFLPKSRRMRKQAASAGAWSQRAPVQDPPWVRRGWSDTRAKRVKGRKQPDSERGVVQARMPKTRVRRKLQQVIPTKAVRFARELTRPSKTLFQGIYPVGEVAEVISD